MATYNAKEAAARAGVSTNTIRTAITSGRLKANKGEAVGGPAEWVIESDALDEYIRRRKRPARRDGDLRQEVTQLRVQLMHAQEEIRDLQRDVTLLFQQFGETQGSGEGRQVASTTYPGMIPSPTPSTAQENALRNAQPRRGPIRRSSLQDELPHDWIPLSAWCKLHDINPRSVYRDIEAGAMPAPHTRAAGEGWQHGQQEVLRAYDPTQHAEASRYAARKWPARFHPCEACARLVQHYTGQSEERASEASTTG
jgi:hypothetical protein